MTWQERQKFGCDVTLTKSNIETTTTAKDANNTSPIRRGPKAINRFQPTPNSQKGSLIVSQQAAKNSLIKKRSLFIRRTNYPCDWDRPPKRNDPDPSEHCCGFGVWCGRKGACFQVSPVDHKQFARFCFPVIFPQVLHSRIQ